MTHSSSAILVPRCEQPTVAQHSRERYSAAVLLTTAICLAAVVLSEHTGNPLFPLTLALPLAPIIVAAYHRRGGYVAALVVAVFITAHAPAVVAARSLAGVVSLAAYTLFLSLFAYLAARLSANISTRSALTSAVRGWEALLERAASLDEVIAFLLKEATALASTEWGALLLRSPVSESWQLFSLEDGAVCGRSLAPAGSETSLAQWLLYQDRSQLLNDLDSDPRFCVKPTCALRSVLAQPLRQPDGSTIGMLVLGNNRDRDFSRDDSSALKDLIAAGQQALKQAGVVARADDILAHRVRQLGALERSARELNIALDPQRVVDDTLVHALGISSGDAALVSVDAPDLAPLYRVRNGSLTAEQIGQATAWGSQLMQPLLDRGLRAPIAPLLAAPATRMIVPLRRHGQPLGAIVVEGIHARTFGQDTLRALAGLADQAAIALDNARLFARILREKQKSEQIVHNMADALLTVDDQGQVNSLNPAGVTLTGWRAEEAMGHTLCDVLGCRDGSSRCQDCVLLAAMRQPASLVDDCWVIRQRSGMQRVVELRATPLDSQQEQPGGLVVLLHDVTERRENERFEQELIAAFSHDLRTPLTNIGMITEMMLAGNGEDLDDAEREQLQLLQAQSRRLEEFADRILELNQLETDAPNLEMRPLPLSFTLARLAQQWRALAPRRRLTVSTPAAALWVWADEQAVQRVLNILLDNANKYAPEGSPVDLALRAGQPGYAMVTVEDQGPGIAPCNQARLFDRFYRVDRSDAQRVYGHGLGLFIARGLVEQMDGTLWVESEEGCGSRFVFTLPLMMEGPDDNLGDRG